MKKIIVFALFLGLVLVGCSLKSQSAKSLLGPEEAKAKAESFINENLMSPGASATITEIVEEGDLYKIKVNVGNGQDVESYISKDGETFFPQAYSIEEIEKEAQAQQSAAQTSSNGTSSYTADDLAKISTFVNCLAEKKVKIYGANWCGWTKKLVVDTLGGFDVAAPIYVECTEETEICSQEGVQGYPTVKINGEAYEGERTFEGLAQATGCAAPGVATPASASGDATCN